jgi:hypothetical protein
MNNDATYTSDTFLHMHRPRAHNASNQTECQKCQTPKYPACFKGKETPPPYRLALLWVLPGTGAGIGSRTSPGSGQRQKFTKGFMLLGIERNKAVESLFS